MNADDFFEEKKVRVALNSAVNVIYFTNKCNLACTYCYEDLANRPSQIMTREDIRNRVDEILEREGPEEQTLIVLFGGEPTLEWDNACYLMEYAWNLKKKVHFNLTTNGIKFLSESFIQTVMNNYFYERGYLSIDISFDGVGNGERIFPNGQVSTKSMLKVFANLDLYKMRYRIRYTIQKANIRKAYEDISLIIQTFNPLRLITSVTWADLSDEEMALLPIIKEKFRMDWTSNKLNIPVCELLCDMCGGCQEHKELRSYHTTEGKVNQCDNKMTIQPFNDFKNKENTDECNKKTE